MRKINSILLLLFCIVINNYANSQTTEKIVFTIGSSYAPTGNCYPATPAPIRPPGGTANNNSSSDPQENQTNSFLVTANNEDYTAILTTAYARGFRKFYFQEGLYLISSPINLNGLHGITIEGAGARTTFKAGSTTLEAIFKISNNYNSKIMNLNMDLKTTLNCTSPTDAADANTGIKIGAQVGRCLFEEIYS